VIILSSPPDYPPPLLDSTEILKTEDAKPLDEDKESSSNSDSETPFTEKIYQIWIIFINWVLDAIITFLNQFAFEDITQ